MITFILIGVVLAVCLALVVAVARDPGPEPGEVAVSYELGWDRLDFTALWTLSAAELRDGLDRHHFVAAKRAAYGDQPAMRGLVEHVDVEAEQRTSSGDHALVTTNVTLRDGTAVRNHVHLVRRTSRWQVVAYQLAPAPS